MSLIPRLLCIPKQELIHEEEGWKYELSCVDEDLCITYYEKSHTPGEWNKFDTCHFPYQHADQIADAMKEVAEQYRSNN